MKNYAFVVGAKEGPLSPSWAVGALQTQFPVVVAATIATHTEPWIVVLHANGELTPGDRDAIQSILDSLEPS